MRSHNLKPFPWAYAQGSLRPSLRDLRWCSNFSLRNDHPILCIDQKNTNHVDAKEKPCILTI